MNIDDFTQQLPDADPSETAEWIDSFNTVIDVHGKTRARFLLMKLLEQAKESQVGISAPASTPYINTIPTEAEPWFPGNEDIERRIRAYIRWNAAIMVLRANIRSPGIGGHLSTYASSAALFEVGFNHFFKGKQGNKAGDQVFFQGHASPGIYARAFLEGRLSEEQLDNFRFETHGNGLSSYPHPRSMPDFWEFPTVSMGLGPLCAIYQAHFNRYLLNRHIVDTSQSRVWCFAGDGEFDEPESLGALGVAAREGLDNLTFVINCNLQRLDGPVRGNGKIIQELESIFRGFGWNVIKVIWGSKWDELLAKDTDGVLVNKMNTTLDGDFQKYATETGAYIREHFFGPDPRLRNMVEHLSDKQLQALPRGGHDYKKLYSAYKVATEHKGSPTVILAKTVKGWALGPEIEARNATHQIKKMNKAQLIALRDRLGLEKEIPDLTVALGPDDKSHLDRPPYYRPPEDSEVYRYMMQRRTALNGCLPQRVVRSSPLPLPDGDIFAEFEKGSNNRKVSTTMAFATMLKYLLRDEKIGKLIVPIIPDEARTFGLDPLFNEVQIYSPVGQNYTPVDSDLLLSYKESVSGQMLEEGITEAGATASFMAASTAYATWSQPMIPFFLFYSIFGFGRVGDLMWALGDIRGRGFLMGCTAGRTTLNGEGLQHADGHSLILASVIPNLRVYDCAFAYEITCILQDGIKRMYGPEPEDCFYYLTLYNENYPMPGLPNNAEEALRVKNGISAGMYLFSPTTETTSTNRFAKILFSGTGFASAMEAQQILNKKWSISSECWSVTSYKALREEALNTERWNRLHPNQQPRIPYITQQLSNTAIHTHTTAQDVPIVAVSDFMKAVPDQVARWIPGTYISLGTDGFGRSDTREQLRRYFETDAAHIVIAVLSALAQHGNSNPAEIKSAMQYFGIDPDTMDRWRI